PGTRVSRPLPPRARQDLSTNARRRPGGPSGDRREGVPRDGDALLAREDRDGTPTLTAQGYSVRHDGAASVHELHEPRRRNDHPVVSGQPERGWTASGGVDPPRRGRTRR